MTINASRANKNPTRKRSTRNASLVIAAAAILAGASAFAPSHVSDHSTNGVSGSGATSGSSTSVVLDRTTRSSAALSVASTGTGTNTNSHSNGINNRSAVTNSDSACISADTEHDETHMESSATSMASSSPRGLHLPDHEQNSEFELKLGKAMDTLRQDYPDLLTRPPTYSIYDPDLETVDPSGVTLHSLKSYKTSFQFLHMVIKLFYCPDQSGLTFKLVYDCARKNIRVSWNAVLVPRLGSGGKNSNLYVDGISVYELDRGTGLINQHRVEHLLVNDAPVQAPQGIFAVLRDEATQGPEGVGIPVFYGYGRGNAHNSHEEQYELDFAGADGRSHSGHSQQCNAFDKVGLLEFSSGANRFPSFLSPSSSSSLFSMDNDHHHNHNGENDEKEDLFDRDAFERKNKSRLKFGLPPITEAEFVQIEAKTRELALTQNQKKAAAATSAAEMQMEDKNNKDKNNKNPLSKLFGSVLKDTCEDNFDCERPEVCCDFGFKKMCCRSGMGVFDGVPGQQQLQKIPVQVVADDDQWARKGGPGGMDDYY